ncbi:MAG: hypothetical protein ACXACX_10195, partial [Candidatus Hodarchaeales archaeon]
MLILRNVFKKKVRMLVLIFSWILTGLVTISFYAIDSIGYQSNKNLNLSEDSDKPVIIIISPQNERIFTGPTTFRI